MCVFLFFFCGRDDGPSYMVGPELNFAKSLEVDCSLKSSFGILEMCLQKFYVFFTTNTDDLCSPNNNWYLLDSY